MSFKDAVNSALRDGLRPEAASEAKFVQKTFDLGAEQRFQWDKALSVAAAMEDEEISRKLAIGK